LQRLTSVEPNRVVSGRDQVIFPESGSLKLWSNQKWVSFYKSHREVLDSDMIHLRRPDGRDWDGFVYVNPQGNEKALAFLYNPLEEEISREIRIPLYYAGRGGRADMTQAMGLPLSLVNRHGVSPTRGA
jgi:hypothetical protein